MDRGELGFLVMLGALLAGLAALLYGVGYLLGGQRGADTGLCAAVALYALVGFVAWRLGQS